ncbi:DUF1284 domain-containing protein [Phyllobacterium sp. 0TCS1.6A]|uniref:DUF1284 domain-containing protein n=1 Tax=Phyllobacterium sp. 0TCS1.6A TaxID=2995637 RepID=UPI00226521B3|nr:DUF1284 domain-containing protein [Phyllobacterium sp. 0TCS1.6A]MCX8292996.1 DUF1284 domain-containing protein [Phyllobacterium sp. 0TCS1.6A]
MTVRLRPHHLLCMLTYVGKGYSEAFVDNYDRIIARLSAGEDVLICEGPDDVCGPLLVSADAHCRRESVTVRDRNALREVGLLQGRPLAVGDTMRLDAGLLAAFRDAFAKGATRSACGGCEWADLCSRVAKSGFDNVRLVASAVRHTAQ